MKKQLGNRSSGIQFSVSVIPAATILAVSTFMISTSSGSISQFTLPTPTIASSSMRENVTRTVQRGRRRYLTRSTERRSFLSNVFHRVGESATAFSVSRTAVQVTGSSICSVNENGFFGYPSRQVLEVPYLYQVTVVANTSTFDITNTIAPALDFGIANAILPFLFVQCGTQVATKSLMMTPTNPPNNNRLRRRYLQPSIDREEPIITAISAKVADQFLFNGGLRCSGTISAGDCYVVNGQVTILGDNLIPSATADTKVLPAIQYVMQSSLLTTNISNVLSVQYLDTNRTSVAPITAPPLPAPTTVAPVSTNVPTSVPVASPIISTAPTSYVPFTFAPVNALPSPTPGSSAAPAIVSPTSSPFSIPNSAPVIPPTSSPQTTSGPASSPINIPLQTPTTRPTSMNSRNRQSPFTCWQCSLFGVACVVAFIVGVMVLANMIRRHRRLQAPPDQGFAEVVVVKRKDDPLKESPDDGEDPYIPPPDTMTSLDMPYIPQSHKDTTKTGDDDSPTVPINLTTTLTTTVDENEEKRGDEQVPAEDEDADEEDDAGASFENDVDHEQFVLGEDVEDDDEEVDEEDGLYDEEEEEEEYDVTYREEEDEYVVTDDEEDDGNEIFEEESYYDEVPQYELNEEQVNWATQNHPFGDHSFT